MPTRSARSPDVLFRVFGWLPDTQPEPLRVLRDRQGGGRHDDPDRYTALYLAREPVGAVAEAIQAFRGQELTAEALVRPDGARRSLATVDDSEIPALVDLDDPRVLVARRLRPSAVASGIRRLTQRIAGDAFDSGAFGLSWWSTLEASWTNVTLFDERLASRPRVVEAIALTLDDPVVVEAAERLGVRLAGPPGRGRRTRLTVVR
ncbi:MAG: RES family NAD+ phosphorylase [Chloroflexota bacterium]|nr:RES family NAD+ phosphorylase [Chloroflexota bacterium]